MMEDYLQTEWPELEVWLTSITEQWAVIAVQGPQRAARCWTPLVDGSIIEPRRHAAHERSRDGTICGVPTRLFRVSFTGELGFEINVPADYGRGGVGSGVEAGRPHGITAYGTEAMHVLRAEKGYIIVGQETDGTVTPDDLGLGMGDRQGQAGLRRQALAGAPGHELARAAPAGRACSRPIRAFVLEEGSQVAEDAAPPPGTRSLGSRDLVLWRGDAGALDCARHGGARPGADGRDASCAARAGGDASARGVPGVPRPGRGAAQCLTWSCRSAWRGRPPAAR